jgi:hypothetical protein
MPQQLLQAVRLLLLRHLRLSRAIAALVARPAALLRR